MMLSSCSGSWYKQCSLHKVDRTYHITNIQTHLNVCITLHIPKSCWSRTSNIRSFIRWYTDNLSRLSGSSLKTTLSRMYDNDPRFAYAFHHLHHRPPCCAKVSLYSPNISHTHNPHIIICGSMHRALHIPIFVSIRALWIKHPFLPHRRHHTSLQPSHISWEICSAPIDPSFSNTSNAFEEF